MNNLDLALVGNSRVAVLINPLGTMVWGCFPRFDSDATFCALLGKGVDTASHGFWSIELDNGVHHEQHYLRNTPVLITRLTDSDGGAVEITDFAPRFEQFGRIFCPMMIMRRIRRLHGHPRIRIRLRPARDWGAEPAQITHGSHHLRYLTPEVVLRLTTDASITAVQQEQWFYLQEDIHLILGPDESIQDRVSFVADRFLTETLSYWHDWVRNLAIPFEWQEAVIRAAITLQLNTYEDTGAIIAAMTTSIPEAADSGRNWDYRYCWLRDAYFVINALNRLSTTQTMERYLSYIINITAGTTNGEIQPVYRIDGDSNLEESVIASLAGYRGMGPVRIGNGAHVQIQNDVYGSIILASTHMFFDSRLHHMGDRLLFDRLEVWGQRAYESYLMPDAGLWELRAAPTQIHTFSSVMCWVACDRLARIAARLGLEQRATYWRDLAITMRKTILSRAWNERLHSFTSALDGQVLDASLLLLAQLRIVAPTDPRFRSTVECIGRELKVGEFVFRYKESDDFGRPENAFVVCTFWYIDALASIGRKSEARALFEHMLSCRNAHGLLAEHICPSDRSQWGNYAQTYSMVGLVNSAARLSLSWEEAF